VTSPASEFITRCDEQTLTEVLARCSVVQLAALRYDWADWWARPKQRIPDGPWRSYGFLTGRGFGKTRTISEWVQQEVFAGRAERIALIAQNEDKTIEVMIEGESGLLATSPPWFKARYESGRVLWPNGAQAFVYTPFEPQNVHGPEHHLAWCSEIARWPAATRDEAMADLRRGLRLGYGKLIWDTTPRRRNPLVRKLLERAASNPTRHVVVRGSMRENEANLTPEFVQEQIDEYGGTQQGAEQIDGVFLDDSAGALFRQAWIDAARRSAPGSFRLRILSVDPAISTRRGTDRTGIVDLGQGDDEQIYVLGDMSGKHAPEEWARVVLDAYGRNECNAVIVERNRGGDLVASNLRAQAQARGWRVIVLDLRARLSPYRAGIVYVKEVHTSRTKETRAEPVAGLYERGRVSHAHGADLRALEDTLTTWEPTPTAESPDALDALVHGVYELAGLRDDRPDARAGFKGITDAAKSLTRASSADLSAALSGLRRTSTL